MKLSFSLSLFFFPASRLLEAGGGDKTSLILISVLYDLVNIHINKKWIIQWITPICLLKRRPFLSLIFNTHTLNSETHTWTWQEGDCNISSGYLWLVRFQMVFFLYVFIFYTFL